MFDAERMGGAFDARAPWRCREERFDAWPAIVNALPEVAHNYEREHALNMWFVLATERPSGSPPRSRAIEAADRAAGSRLAQARGISSSA